MLGVRVRSCSGWIVHQCTPFATSHKSSFNPASRQGIEMAEAVDRTALQVRPANLELCRSCKIVDCKLSTCSLVCA